MVIENVCVIGAGVMGRQIALNAAISGCNVIIFDTDATALISALKWCNAYLARSVEKGKITADDANGSKSRVRYSSDIEEALEKTDLVIEAIIEKEEIKRELFIKVAAIVSEKTIIASNSSYIASSAYKDDINNPERLCNLHYFNPVMKMELVEIVRGEHTGDETVESIKAFAQKINKQAIVVEKEVEGFVVNRLLKALQDEAYYLVENGIASVEDVDIGVEKGLNHPMGPFRLMDFTGLDINFYNRKRRFEKSKDPKEMPPKCLTEKIERGEFGRKSGKGWYEY